MKYKKTLITVCLIACILFTISAVAAVDVNQTIAIENEPITEETVSTTNDDEILTTDDGTFTALQNKINNATDGSTITLENDYTFDDGFSTEGIYMGWRTLTIDGNGHTLNGLSKSRILKMEIVSNVIIKNTKFKNGYSTKDGGAIYISTVTNSGLNLNLINCEFENNVASDGGAFYADHAITSTGSAISLTGIINNCTFKNNKANYDGGAISIPSETDKMWFIINSNFNNNQAKSGGAIYSKANNVNIIDSKFDNNVATTYNGGAIDLSYITSNGKKTGGFGTNITNCEFNNNKANGRGGAIYCDGDNSTLDSSTFNYNTATSFGDAVYWYGENGVINNCKSFTKSDENNNIAHGQTTIVKGFDVTLVKSTSDSQSSSSSSSTSSSTKITKTTPKLTAKAATFKVKTKTKKYTVTLKTNKNKVMKNVKLYLKVNKKTYTAKTNSKGKATFKITKLTKKGTYKTTITYKGSSTYNKVTKTIKIKCK